MKLSNPTQNSKHERGSPRKHEDMLTLRDAQYTSRVRSNSLGQSSGYMIPNPETLPTKWGNSLLEQGEVLQLCKSFAIFFEDIQKVRKV